MTVWRVIPLRKQSGRRVNDAILDEEDVGAGRFGDLAAIIQHHRIGVALGFGGLLGMVQIT